MEICCTQGASSLMFFLLFHIVFVVFTGLFCFSFFTISFLLLFLFLCLLVEIKQTHGKMWLFARQRRVVSHEVQSSF